MSEDLQHIDELFRDAFENEEETPSSGVRQSLIAHLDNEDAVMYKRKFIAIKRIAIVLIFLLLSLVIYEAGINRNKYEELTRKENINANKNRPVNNTNKVKESSSPEKEERREKSSIVKKDLPDYSSGEPDSAKFLSSRNINIPQNRLLQTLKKKISSRDQLITITKKAYNNKVKDIFINRLAFDKKDSRVNKNKRYSLRAISNNIGKSSAFTFIQPIENNQTIEKSEKGIDFRSIVLPHILSYSVEVNMGISIDELEKRTPVLIVRLSDSTKGAIVNTNIQQKKPGSDFKTYWELTALATRELARYNLENDISDNNSNQQDEKTQIEQRENHEPSFSVGLLASYEFKKYWALQTGLIYSNTAIVIDPQKIYATAENNGNVAYKYNLSSGYAFVKPNFGLPPSVGDSISTSQAQHNLKYFSIPIILKYKLTNKRLSIAPGIGLSANFLTSATIQTEVEDALNKEAVTISKLDGTKLFYAGVIANADIQYKISSKFSLNMIPSFRYAITPVTKNNIVKTYPYSFGLGAGITFRF